MPKLKKMSYGKEKLWVGEEIGEKDGGINIFEEKAVELVLLTM